MKRKPEAYRSWEKVSKHENFKADIATFSEWTYEYWDVLEAVRLVAVVGHTRPVLDHKGDFDDTRQPSRHEGIAKHLVGHSAGVQRLGVRRHGPAGNQ